MTDEDDTIIGASLVGPHVTDLLTELSLAVGLGLKAKDVGKVIHAHPSLSEGLMEAIQIYTVNVFMLYQKNNLLTQSLT